jgi:hypothetical protein
MVFAVALVGIGMNGKVRGWVNGQWGYGNIIGII